jgi:polysaccharide export outer membrane protein
MRVARSFLLICAVALNAAGCAFAPRVQYAAAPPPAPQGIDNVVYGATPATPPPTAPVAYNGNGPPYRGLIGGPTPLFPAPAPAVVRPAPVMAAPMPPPVAAPIPVAAPGPAPFAASPPMLGPDAGPPFQLGSYTLDSGDRLRVVVFGQDGLTNSYVVDVSGHIAMPLIGSVSARGLTSVQLAGRIAEALRQGFIREPHVAVEVEAYRPFFILGEVAQPGQYPYTPNMTVETAVAIAGGFGPRALHHPVTVSHNIGGQVLRYDVPLTYQVQPGDTIKVKERWF